MPPAAPNPALDAAAAASSAVAAAEANARGTASDASNPDEVPVARRPPAPAAATKRPRASRIFPIRIALVAAMGATLGFLGGRAFDEFVPELLLPPVVVCLLAAFVRRRPLVLRAAVEVVGFAATTLAAGILTGSSARGVLGDLADGPQRLLTTEWPSPLDSGVAMAIAAMVGATTAVAADLAGRPRFHLAPLAPIALGFIGVMAVAAPVAPTVPTLAVLGAAAVALVLARPGDDPRTRARVLAGERSLLATLVGLAIAVLATSGAIAWADRADPRQDVEADVTLSLLDPIEQTAALRSVEPDFPMFEIVDRSALIGPTLPNRWRTSALTDYDGQRWLPTITLRPIGRRLGQPSVSGVTAPPPIEFDLRILTDDVRLVPLPGRPLEVDTDAVAIATDTQRTVVRLVDAPEPVLTVRVVSEVAPTAGEESVAPIGQRQVDEISGAFADAAEELGGDRSDTVLERLRRIESTMRDDWQLDVDAPGAGQQLALIERFVNETRRGTREQFVTAFVLLARSIGVDARVATGFIVPPGSLDTPLTLRSSDAAVWAEVRLGDRGWLAFEPVPREEATDDASEPPPPAQQSPAAPQPPQRPPNSAEEAEPSVPDDDGEVAVSLWRTWAGATLIAGAGVVVPIVALVGAILLAKWMRRRRRMRIAEPSRRIVGIWANTTDSLVDAGLVIAPAWTDERIAAGANDVAPGVPYEVRRLAVSATAVTFGSAPMSDGHVADAVASARAVDRAIRSNRTRLQRLRWRLSTRSLRKRWRSPVAG